MRVTRELVGLCGKHAGRVRVEGGSGASRVRVETRTRDVGCDLYRSLACFLTFYICNRSLLPF